jgi:hypothetical protein
VPFDCTAADTLATCPIRTNTKFDTIRNFTHFIRPGDRMVKVDDVSTVAAVEAGRRGATVVHANASDQARTVTLDLSRFGTVSSAATVTPVVTSAAGKLVRGAPVRVTGREATLTVPAESVTTFLISGVASVIRKAQHLRPGHPFRIAGVQSGRSLTATAGSAALTIRTTDPARADQLWWITKTRPGVSDRDRYGVVNAGTGQRLAVRDGNLVVEPVGAADEAAQWMVSATGDGTYTFINVAARRVIDVGGEAVADGSAVGIYPPMSGPNQRWSVRDEAVAGTEVVSTHTVPRLIPQLPDTVTAVLGDGERRALPVTRRMPAAKRWNRPGVVTVTGTVTDVLGRVVAAKAKVTVDRLRATLPVVTATATDPYAEIVATKDRRVWTVVSTSEDGTRSSTYRVELIKRTVGGAIRHRHALVRGARRIDVNHKWTVEPLPVTKTQPRSPGRPSQPGQLKTI